MVPSSSKAHISGAVSSATTQTPRAQMTASGGGTGSASSSTTEETFNAAAFSGAAIMKVARLAVGTCKRGKCGAAWSADDECIHAISSTIAAERGVAQMHIVSKLVAGGPPRIL